MVKLKNGEEVKKKDLRVLVAKDVLKRLHRLRLTMRSYIDGIDEKLLNKNKDKDLSDLIPKIQGNCEVCLLGACFLSTVRLIDNMPTSKFIKFTDDPNEHFIEHYLEKVFSLEQQKLMEAAFELTSRLYYHSITVQVGPCHVNDAVTFGGNFAGNKYDRVRAVMQNVISNNGEFNPKKGKHAITANSLLACCRPSLTL